MITAIKTRIVTGNYKESLRFYTEILDLRIVAQWDQDGDKGTILGLGEKEADGFLELGWSEKPERVLGLCLQFRVANISQFLDAVAGAWQHCEPTRKSWGSTYVNLVDPNGVPVIIFEGNV
jgi:catechol 2,3-dioxygenase-like lactoylglutathione lyase family enzyme